MEKFITAAGCAIRISDRGPGDSPCAMVLLHGYLESLDVWDDFTGLLPRDMRVVAPDLPGHGISEVVGPVHTMAFLADAVDAALEQIGVQRCMLVGHSMGGYAALEMLRRYPARVASIVLFHSTPNPDSPEKRENRDRETEVVLQGKKDLLAHSVAKGFAAANRSRLAWRMDELADQIYLTEDEGIVALLRGMRDRDDTNDAFAASTVPKLLIFGRGDEHISPAVAQTVAERHPDARVAWLENSGHEGFLEEPELSAQLLTEFYDL